jgi:hypothetical protein
MTKLQAFLTGFVAALITGGLSLGQAAIGYTPDVITTDICKVKSFNTQSVTLFCADRSETIVYPRSRYEAIVGEPREGKVSGP